MASFQYRGAFHGLFAAVILQASVTSASADPSSPALGLPLVLAKASDTPSLRAFGERLFSDARLSKTSTVSCATCHDPERAFSDGRPRAIGIEQQVGTRNTPSLVNVAYATSLFWDGRRDSLETQALDPLVNSMEHGLASEDQALRIVASDPSYCKLVEDAFGVECQMLAPEHIGRALAAFERTLLFGDSPFDRFQYGHEAAALTASQIRGFELFRGRARCATCHTVESDGALFTDHRFHSLGVGMRRLQGRVVELVEEMNRHKSGAARESILRNADIAELGRYVVTGDPKDIGRFKTPSLRNVAVTGPYMHDGSVATLEEAVDLEVYYRTSDTNRPVVLTPGERRDLVDFLRSLTSPQFSRQ